MINLVNKKFVRENAKNSYFYLETLYIIKINKIQGFAFKPLQYRVHI